MLSTQSTLYIFCTIRAYTLVVSLKLSQIVCWKHYQEIIHVGVKIKDEISLFIVQLHLNLKALRALKLSSI